MKKIKLTQGQYTLVDDADYDWLNIWKWCALNMNGNFYVLRNSPEENGKSFTILMARQILGLERGDKRQGDHKNHNTLDNQRDNLRICTIQQNHMNQKNQQNISSQYKGVSWNRFAKKWAASIKINGKKEHLGYFHNEIFAAGVYDETAKKYFGDFACLNFN